MPQAGTRRNQLAAAAVAHLRAQDSVLRDVIDRVGPFSLKLQQNRYRSLVRAIVAQQISVHAARSILNRLEGLCPSGTITPAEIAVLSADQRRGCGLSAQKAAYLADLTEKVLNGEVRLQRIGRLTDEEVIAELIQVKGIGVWTAQMFLIFSLGRWNIFPHADLGVRSALQRLYGLAELPNRATSEKIAAPWQPYCSVASWYCWRSGELR